MKHKLSHKETKIQNAESCITDKLHRVITKYPALELEILLRIDKPKHQSENAQ